jgi:hypothetical protein
LGGAAAPPYQEGIKQLLSDANLAGRRVQEPGFSADIWCYEKSGAGVGVGWLGGVFGLDEILSSDAAQAGGRFGGGQEGE